VSGEREHGFFERVRQGPALRPGKLSQVKPRDLAIRFVAGGLTSVVSGAVTLVFGARVGGLFLAFPAILAASLTLIEEDEDASQAREDARGAVVGGFAMAAFAAVAALSLTGLGGALALALAAAAWAGLAVGGYFTLWR
jgi:Protein of unknown function (DUF3147)